MQHDSHSDRLARLEESVAGILAAIHHLDVKLDQVAEQHWDLVERFEDTARMAKMVAAATSDGPVLSLVAAPAGPA